MAKTPENRSSRLVNQAARLPSRADFAGYLAIAAAIGGFALLTAAIRFQLVDWRVESRDLQTKIRRAESEVLRLGQNIATLRQAGHLKESAAPVLGLVPAGTLQVSKLEVDPRAVRRYERAFEAESPTGSVESIATASVAAPLAAMFRGADAESHAGAKPEPTASEIKVSSPSTSSAAAESPSSNARTSIPSQDPTPERSTSPDSRSSE